MPSLTGLSLPALMSEKLPDTNSTNQEARRAVYDFTRWAHKVRRVVTPDAGSWERAGELLGEIRQREPHLRSKLPTVWNDVLIALSARHVGAMVVTHNARDFELLRHYLRFDLHISS